MGEIKAKGSLYGDNNLSLRATRYFPVIAGLFCGFLVLSNILAVKPITVGSYNDLLNLSALQIWPLVLDGGALLFPLTYIIDDVLSEIYGFKTARKVIFTGFALEICAVLMIWLVGLMPSTSDWGNEEAFNSVLGFVPRIVFASLCAYLVGELLNSFVLVKIKQKWGERRLWVRLIGSTLVGEAADTSIFCTIAFFGVITTSEFLNYIIVGYIFKCLVEVLLLPVTYRVIRFLKGSKTA
ncbi:MAG: queuosine precursor transporter [Candidatus Ancillula sp.]|jgi:uncharacterized integral membrane protein (TIGR00697 family)|nr:queuosine precursor transporter [Candidatus Ancillula sp.]